MQNSVCKSMFPHTWQLCSEWRWHFDLIFNCLNSLTLAHSLAMNSEFPCAPMRAGQKSGCSSLLLHGICCTWEAPQCRGPPSGPVLPMTWKASLPISGFYSRPVCCIPYLSLSELYKAVSLILLFLGNCIISLSFWVVAVIPFTNFTIQSWSRKSGAIYWLLLDNLKTHVILSSIPPWFDLLMTFTLLGIRAPWG